MPDGYPCLTGTYHGYPGNQIPVLHLSFVIIPPADEKAHSQSIDVAVNSISAKLKEICKQLLTRCR